jgi:hypothetical protein
VAVAQANSISETKELITFRKLQTMSASESVAAPAAAAPSIAQAQETVGVVAASSSSSSSAPTIGPSKGARSGVLPISTELLVKI